MAFVGKLNKKEDGSVYVIEEIQTVTEGVYAGYLEHDNVTGSSVAVYTGSKYTGDEITSFALSTDSEASWKTYIKVYAGVDTIYITYQTAGDIVEASDINALQDAVSAAQDELDAYEASNNTELNSIESRVTTVETAKADEISVATRLLLKADKEDTYTKGETDARIEEVVGAAPDALDTLQEIASALNDDSDFAGTMTTQLAAKVDKVTGKDLSTEDYTSEEKTKLTGIEAGAEVNNIPDTNAGLLTGSADTSLHYHSADRNRANHTGMQTASTISDFAATVRTVVLTGLSTVADTAIAATDTTLSAIGKLQAQITANLSTLASHTNNTSNPHNITKSQVGLGNCDNIADTDKSVASAAKLTAARTISINGDATGSASFDGSADASIDIALEDSGAAAGTYRSISVNAKGIVTSGSNPTLTISEGGTGQTTGAGVRNALGLGNTTGALPVTNGGTGAATASGALTNLGLNATASELNYMDGVTANVQTQLDAKAIKSHAATSGTYGLGTAANYGHVKTINALTQSSHADGTALSAYQGYVLNTALAAKASLASPSFTGIPTVPTATSGTNTTQAASTAFVQQELSDAGYGDMLRSIYDTDEDGIVNTAEEAVKLKTARTISVTGDASGETSFDGSEDAEIGLTLTDSGVAAGTYGSVTVNAKGLVTSGSNPTLTISEGGTGQTTGAGVRNALGLGNTTGALPVTNGGTGAATASGALTNLGLNATASELNYMDGVTANVQTQLDAKAIKSHAATSGTYGFGTAANYGHVKTINALTQSSHADGTALSAYQGYVLNTALAAKASLASPSFTGIPTVPTATSGTNTTQAASTAFVQQELSDAGYGDMLRSIYDTDEDGKVNAAVAADNVPWSGVSNKPDTFTPSIHTHDSGTITGVSTDKLSEPAYVTGGITKTAAPLFDVLRADRTAFLPASQIIIEVSTDAGMTWTDAGISDMNKTMLFTGQRPIVAIPLKNGVRSSDCMMRLTITAMRYSVPEETIETDRYSYWNSANVLSAERYCQLDAGWIFCSSVNDRIYMKVERATGAAPNTWITEREAFLRGWSGGNFLSMPGETFGGSTSQSGNFWNRRFTFRTCSTSNTFNDMDLAKSSNTQKQSISHLKLTGKNVWTIPNKMMYHDHLYYWDVYQNALFPAMIQGTQLESTAAAGTAPLIVESPTVVSNLNADMLDGKEAEDFMPKGPLTWGQLRGGS